MSYRPHATLPHAALEALRLSHVLGLPRDLHVGAVAPHLGRLLDADDGAAATGSGHAGALLHHIIDIIAYIKRLSWIIHTCIGAVVVARCPPPRDFQE